MTACVLMICWGPKAPSPRFSYQAILLSFSEAELHINKIRKRLGYDPLHFPIQPPPVIYSGEEVLKTINQQKN